MNSLESRSHGHKYFEYEFCTPTQSKTIQSERHTPQIQRKPSNQNVTPHKYSKNHPIRTSHPINTTKTIQSERHTP